MARRGRPVPQLVLTDDEIGTLRTDSQDDTASRDARLRARIVLACAEGMSDVEVSLALGVHRMTVAKWRTRFTENRHEGLRDGTRSGRPRALTPDAVALVIGATVDAWPPDGRWSRTTMARQTGLSKSTVGRIWREYGIAPHQIRTPYHLTGWLPTERIVDIVGLYLSPPQRAFVFGVAAEPTVKAVDWSSSLARPRRDDESGPTHHSVTIQRTVTHLIAGLVTRQPAHRAANHADGFERFLSTLDTAMPAGAHIRALCHGLDDATSQGVGAWGQHPRFQIDVVAALAAWTIQVGQWLFHVAHRTVGPADPDGVDVAGWDSIVSLERRVTSWALDWTTKAEPLLWFRPGPVLAEARQNQDR